MAPAIGSHITEHTSNRKVTSVGFAALAATTLAVLVLATPAFALGPKPSSKVSGSTVPLGSYTPSSPFSSGQVIAIKIPPNSTLTPGAGIKIVECAAPGGQVPSNPAACDGSTIQGNTVYVQPNGSVDYTRTKVDTGYTVYALPDFHSLGEPKDSRPICDLTHECVLYIGQNQLVFTAPHFWSEPFKVRPTANDTGANPGDGDIAASGGSNNALLTIGLPIVVLVVVGGLFVARRRRRPATTVDVNPREKVRT
jgi:LPXTG-motif cell wall-anchored protein